MSLELLLNSLVIGLTFGVPTILVVWRLVKTRRKTMKKGQVIKMLLLMAVAAVAGAGLSYSQVPMFSGIVVGLLWLLCHYMTCDLAERMADLAPAVFGAVCAIASILVICTWCIVHLLGIYPL